MHEEHHHDNQILNTVEKKLHWSHHVIEVLGVLLCVGVAAGMFLLWDYDHKVADDIERLGQYDSPIEYTPQHTASSTLTSTSTNPTDEKTDIEKVNSYPVNSQ